MSAMFFRIIKDRWLLILIYIIAAIAFLSMYVGLFPSFSSQMDSMKEMLKSYPESFLKAFGFDINNFTTLEGFLATEEYSLMWPILSLFMVIGFAGAALAGEIEKGTMEILLSQPISRLKIYFSRYIAGLLMIIVYVGVTIYAIIPLANMFNVSYVSGGYTKLFYLGLMFMTAVFSFAYMLSAIFSDRGKVYFITGGMLVLMYVANILSAIKDSLENLKFASFFYYYSPSKALVYHEIDKWSFWVFAGVTIVCLIIGAIIYSRRDITT
jgi:ABC-2 type transport system permease protein